MILFFAWSLNSGRGGNTTPPGKGAGNEEEKKLAQSRTSDAKWERKCDESKS